MNVEIVTPTIELPDCEPILDYTTATDEEWHAIRKTGIGGSEAAAVCDMDPHKSAFVLCAEKTGRIQGFQGNDLTDMGQLMEPHIRQVIIPDYFRRNDIEATVIDPTHTYRSTRWPWMIVNIDGFVMTDVLKGLEIKNNGEYRLKEYGGIDGDELPDPYYVQDQHAMAVTGLREWWHFAFIGGNRLVWRVVPRNDSFIDWVVERERQLWEIIQQNEPLLFPLPKGTDADMDALMEMGAGTVEGVVDLSEVDDMLDLHVYLGEEIREREAERDMLGVEIINLMGTYSAGETDRHKVGFTRYEREHIDTGKMKRDHRELVEKYTTWTEVGRLSVRRRK